MSAQRIGPKKIRAIERTIGEPVLRGWSHGGYWLGFVTPDHRHGMWNTVSHKVEWGYGDIGHYTSCRETWPHDVGT